MLSLVDCHDEVNYTRDGLNRLGDETESAKKLLIHITSKLPSCREDLVLHNSIKRLEYSVKWTLKKIRVVQGHIELNPGRPAGTVNIAVEGGAQAIAPRIRAPAVTTNAVASFAELLPPSRNLNYILPDLTPLESHPVGTFTAPTVTPKYQ